MPFTVQTLIQDNPPLATARLSESISDALLRMIEHDYSQLPVIDEENRVLGMVAHDSIIQALQHFPVSLDKLRVADAMRRAVEFRTDADLFELLDTMRDRYAALVVDGERHLIGIVTNYDTTEYFRQRAEDMMLVEDIESSLKDYIQLAFSKQEGGLDEARLQGAIQRMTDKNSTSKEGFRKALQHYLKLVDPNSIEARIDETAFKVAVHEYPKQRTTQKTFTDLTFYEYTDLFLSRDCWSKFSQVIKLEEKAVRHLLDNVRLIRNDLAHFRGEVSTHQRNQLRYCADWLGRYQLELFKHLSIGVDEAEIIESKGDIDEPVANGEIIPVEEEISPDDSRYAPLAIWLLSQPPDKNLVKPRFSRIEEIIGDALPDSAYKHRAWWSNDTLNHPHSQQWLEVGWRVASVSINDQVVRFARIQERQKAYIEFYNALFALLSQREELSKVRAAPDGTNWHWVATVANRDNPLASFNFSFGRGNIFRVELYIDTHDKGKNKQIFDWLYTRREEIESKVGKELTWQRLDDRRASRIAIILDGSITDGNEKLEKLRRQAVRSMVAFYRGIMPFLDEMKKSVLVEG